MYYYLKTIYLVVVKIDVLLFENNIPVVAKINVLLFENYLNVVVKRNVTLSGHNSHFFAKFHFFLHGNSPLRKPALQFTTHTKNNNSNIEFLFTSFLLLLLLYTLHLT